MVHGDILSFDLSGSRLRHRGGALLGLLLAKGLAVDPHDRPLAHPDALQLAAQMTNLEGQNAATSAALQPDRS